MPHSKPVPPPYTLDRAVADEEEFWRNIGEIIEERVTMAVETALIKYGLREAVTAMRTAAKTTERLAQRVDTLGKHVVGLVGNYDQLVGWCTNRSTEEDMLRARIDKFFETVTPNVPAKTPPSGGPET